MSFKLNSKTLFDKEFLLGKLEKLKGVNTALLNTNKNKVLLLKSIGINKKNIKIVGELQCETETINAKDYIRLIDENQLFNLSLITKNPGDDNDHLIGDDDN